MRKKLNCWLAIILILCMLPIQTFAASIQPRREFYVVMALCAHGLDWDNSDGSSSILGHAFLAFYNDSDFDIRVGHMWVPAGGSVTVGTFPKDSHNGIWYNIEAFKQPTDVYALEYVLTESEFETVKWTINNNDEYVLSSDNCTHFACDVWNSVVPDNQQITGGIPSGVILQITQKSSYFSNYALPSKSIGSIAYHTATGITYDSSGGESSGSSS